MGLGTSVVLSEGCCALRRARNTIPWQPPRTGAASPLPAAHCRPLFPLFLVHDIHKGLGQSYSLGGEGDERFWSREAWLSIRHSRVHNDTYKA
ncbi:hypothetical protein PENSPDRAFT_651447 [Peniophora sp. CONT]|nr:hypothetical protein PENSPDRAFT_651447 [Peniophora sp. CONT]